MLPRRRAAALPLALLALVVLPTAGCRPDLVVRTETRLYEDGSLERVLELRGTPGDPEETVDDDWLEAEAGVALAEPRRWGRVTAGPGVVRAEGFFQSASELPPHLVYRTDVGPREDAAATDVEIRDLGLVRIWSFTERHADPVGQGEVEDAVNALVEMAVDLLGRELRLHFGDELDTTRAQDVFRQDGRALTLALLTAARLAPGAEREDERHAAYARALEGHGAPVASAGDESFWERQAPALLDWSRARVAAALSTEEWAVPPDALSFWPDGDDAEEELMAMVRRHYDEDALAAEVEARLGALSGYFGNAGSPRFRFESRLHMPGILLTTNGSPASEGEVVWFYRAEDLGLGELVLRAESARLDEESLRRLGARTWFEREQLLQLVDLLDRRDPQRRLAAVLDEALHAGSLAPLRDDDALPDELEPRAHELADLLDPDAPLPPPL